MHLFKTDSRWQESEREREEAREKRGKAKWARIEYAVFGDIQCSRSHVHAMIHKRVYENIIIIIVIATITMIMTLLETFIRFAAKLREIYIFGVK